MPRGTEMCQPHQLMQTPLLLPGNSARCREGRGWENRGRLTAGPDLTFGPPRSSAKVAHHTVSQGGRPTLPSASLPGRDEAPETGAPQSHLAPIHIQLGWQVLLAKGPSASLRTERPLQPRWGGNPSEVETGWAQPRGAELQVACRRGGRGSMMNCLVSPLLDNQRISPAGWIYPKVMCIWAGGGERGLARESPCGNSWDQA